MNNVSHTGGREEKQNKRNGVIATLLIHAGIIALFFFFYLSSPFPPPVSGILINFGTSETGSGDTPSEVKAPEQEVAAASATPPPAVPEAAKQEVATQDVVPAPAVPEPVKKTENVKPVKEVKKTEKTEVKKPEVKDTEPEKPLHPYIPQTENDNPSGQGNTSGERDMGNPDGSNTSDDYGKIPGLGYDYDVKMIGGARSLKSIPPIDENYDKEETVVISIKVDQSGNVLSAKFTLKGSTGTNQTLIRLAEQAALQAKFNPNSQVAVEQFGTITFKFKMK